MNGELLKYLQQDGIGKVVAKGLADLYVQRPDQPVKYLAAWLKKHSANQKEVARLSQQQQERLGKLGQYQTSCQQQQKAAKQESQRQQAASKQLEAFKLKVQNDQYHKELLLRELPQFIEKRLGLTGCYVGQVKHPPRVITDEDEDDQAHLDTSQPKMINYIGSSASHAELMLGKTLLLEKGVTGTALSLSLDDPLPNEDGQVEIKDKYVYVSNVVKNENMHYFRLPKLGAFIAVPLVYQSFLRESLFDLALDARQKYLEELHEFQSQKAEALKEIDAEIETFTQKLTEANEKADSAAAEAARHELEEAKDRRHQKEAEDFPEELPELPTEKREFVVCGDTTGQDCEISPQKRQLLLELVRHFRDSWQAKEKELLYRDVDYQIAILHSQQKSSEAVIEALQKCTEIPPEAKASFDEIEDEQIREYKKSAWQLAALTTEIKGSERFLADFFKLKNFRVVKFVNLIKTLLYFLRFQKQTVNLPGKTWLDWKRVRAHNLFADTFAAFLSFQAEGPKPSPCPSYCKLQSVLENLEKFTEADVFRFNIGLGALLMLAKRQIAHRIANIQLRRSQKDKERERRNALIEENKKIGEEKQQALQKHRQGLSPEELEAFKEQEWAAKYDEDNPLKEIPPEVIDDVDNDF